MCYLLAVLFFMPLKTTAMDINSIYGSSYLDPDKTISMDLKGARLSEVLKIFSQQSGLNFISSSDVADITVDLYLDKVPIEEALERILSANGLTYELKPDSNIFIVKKMEGQSRLVTRVYHLKNATVPASKLNKTLSNFGEETSTQTQTTTTNAKADIVKVIESILTEEGTVSEDPRTNSIVVTDVSTQFPIIEQTIARLDVRIPQIMIEVEMLDVAKGTADLLGAKFGNSPIKYKGGAQKDSLFPFNEDNARDDGFTFANPRYRVGTLSFEGLTLTLQFLRTQTDTKNLARPRILTLNNETAEIRIKTDEAIGVNSTTSQDGAVTVDEAERVETGVFLRVTPQANAVTGEIVMALEPKVVQARTGQTFGSTTFKDPEERGTKSILRVQDGNTIILGGLLRTEYEETKTSVPVLSKIPFVGGAFRHRDRSEKERELIIFITPHILKEDVITRQPQEIDPHLLQSREQERPSDRLQVINKELSVIEGSKF